ncbi:DUF1659 domain-containing protein [Proteinivorax hydrogeniformans]|uniref:DUF1659 domain-containing protein n=1 Tax=Proteinivorax hydrogeniformans TaxID=1826727 RepID=A0AAU8HUX9_9FIRM
MPVTSTPLNTSMRLRYEAGNDDEGNIIYINRSYGRIKADCSDEDFFDIAVALSSLQEHPLAKVRRVDENVLT